MLSARRYVVAWLRSERTCTTETLRSLRSYMLAWGSGRGSAGSSKTSLALAQPERASSEEPASDCDAEGALLAGAAALARRRHAIRIKRKSKIAFRVLRYENYL